MNTDGLADIATAWTAGTHGAENIPGSEGSRLFSTWEITKYLLPIAPAHLRRVLRDTPDLPQGRADNGKSARWFTFDEVCALRQHFSREGVAHKDYLPYRPRGLPAQVICVAQSLRRAGRTTLAAHLAVAAALDGYQVLAIDLDPQGDLAAMLGDTKALGAATNLMARHYSAHLQSENRLRVSRGEMPVPFDDARSEALEADRTQLVTTTRWSGVDLLTSGPALAAADLQTARWQMRARSWRPWDWLGAEHAGEGLFKAYDLVVIDTPPGLGVLALSGITASDLLLVPTRASSEAIAKTGAFFKHLSDNLKGIEDQETAMARALGTPALEFGWQAVRTVLTQYDAAHQRDVAVDLQNAAGRMLLPARQEQTSLIGTDQGRAGCIYDVDYRDFSREGYVTARRSFDETYDEVKRLFTGNWKGLAEAQEPKPVLEQ